MPLLTEQEETAVALYNVNHYNFSEIAFNWLGFPFGETQEEHTANRKKAIKIYCSGMKKLGYEDIKPSDYEINI